MNNETWIYESPDGGDTIFRRQVGVTNRELVKEGALRPLLRRSQLWREIMQAAETDAKLQEMIDKVEIYWHLKKDEQI
jgi:hypothetical protein